MSIAILIKGLPQLNADICANYKSVPLNYNDYIVKSLEVLNLTNNVEIFVHTYNLRINELIKKFNPVEFSVSNIFGELTYDNYLQYNIYSLLSVMNIYLKHVDQHGKNHDKIFIFDMFDKMDIDKSKYEFGFTFNGSLVYGNSVTKINHSWYINFDKLVNAITTNQYGDFYYRIHRDYLNIIEKFPQQQKKMIINFDYNYDNYKKIYDTCSYWSDCFKEYKICGVYKLYNMKNKKYIHITNITQNGIDSIKFDQNKFTPFYIYSTGDKYYIRIQELIPNQNNTRGWHIYAHEDGKVYGAGNNGAWAGFDMFTKDNYVLIKSIHNKKNMLGSEGMYLCVNNDDVVFCNGDQKMFESQWKFIPHDNPINELLACGIFKIKNVKKDMYIYAVDVSPKNTNSIISNTIPTYFYVYTLDNKNYFIRLNENMQNQNGTIGWHLYILPNSDKLYSAGNATALSSFIMIKKGEHHLIKTSQNKYLYMDVNGNIRANEVNETDECLWKFIL